MPNEKKVYILFSVVLVITAAALFLYFQKGGFLGKKASSSPKPISETAKTVQEPRKLPSKIGYTIFEVKPSLIKVKTDKGEAGYTKKFMEERKIYKIVDGQEVSVNFSDLKAGQKLTVHTKEGKEVVGFEVIE